MTRRRSIGWALVAALLSGCSGGGGANQNPGAPSTASPRSALVRATIILPRASKKSATRRGRTYVSPATAGLVAAVSQVTGGTATSYSNTGYDLTHNSSASTCTAGATTTTCVIVFNAPATSSTQSDLFSIYAYDEPQTVGPIAADYVPAGSLLSEDIGPSGAGDPVPSTTGTMNGPIAPGTTANLLFVLDPVVATPVASIAGTFAGSTSNLVLSVAANAGQGNVSNALSIDGYDADNNPIAPYLAPNSGDDTYVNPISDAITPGNRFTLSRSPVTSALTTNDSVTVTYTPLSTDQPSTAGSTALKATIEISDSLSGGGYGGTASLPLASQSVTVAPLFAYAPATATATSATTFTTEVYALQAAFPTNYTGYTLTASTAGTPNNCAAYGATGPTAGTAGTSQQAVFTISTTATPASGTTCTFELSDGISTTTITFSPSGSPT